jgi:polysaccharide biosynthesis protein PelA
VPKIKRENMKTTVIALLLSFCAAFTLYAEKVEIPRTILVLINSSNDPFITEDYNVVHFSAESVLNHLGMNVRYHDVSKGLPSDDSLDEIYGILSYFTDATMPRAKEYCLWATEQIDNGKKFVVWRNFGAFRDADSDEETSKDLVALFFRKLGLEYLENWSDSPFLIDIVEKDDTMMDFENSIEGTVELYEQFLSADAENKVYLRLNRSDLDFGDSDAIVTTPSGGFIMDGCGLFINYIDKRMRWYIDPFKFFSEAFVIEEIPSYDTTTLFGKRILYSHIDGDGMRNISLEDKKTPSGNIIFEEILKKYSLPISVSFITAETNARYLGSAKTESLAREILKFDNIEGGIHGFAHPLDWYKKIVYFPINNYSKKIYNIQELELENSESSYLSGARATVGWKEYLEAETLEAAEYVNENLMPPGKRVAINMWTGNCRAPADAIAIVDSMGIANINGGDTRFDRANPSYTGVAALTRQDKGMVQFQTSNSNENIYTNDWTGPFDGFSYVIESFIQSEYPTLVASKPRRVLPMNIYYHFYSGEREDSVRATKEAYDYALSQDVIPIFASEYVKAARGFVEGKTFIRDDDSWEFRDYGHCRTIRLNSNTIFPDMARSENVLGFVVWESYCYIHLSEGDSAVLYLSNSAPKVPLLESSSAIVYNCKISKGDISFESRTFREEEYTFVNMGRYSKYDVTMKLLGSDDIFYSKKIKSDKKGKLIVRAPKSEAFSIKVLLK